MREYGVVSGASHKESILVHLKKYSSGKQSSGRSKLLTRKNTTFTRLVAARILA